MNETELLTLLLEEPAKYVGHESIEKINAFLNGYRNAVQMEPDPIYRDFSKWLRGKLRVTQDRNWLPIISFFGQGEVDTFNLAKEMWTEYLNEVDYKKQNTKTKVKLSSIGRNKSSELLDKILKRPSVYIGRESVVLTKAFIDGFAFAKYRLGNTGKDRLYAGFQDWIAERFHIKTAHNWACIISFMGVSESNAFTLLKELWSEYKAEKQKR